MSLEVLLKKKGDVIPYAVQTDEQKTTTELTAAEDGWLKGHTQKRQREKTAICRSEGSGKNNVGHNLLSKKNKNLSD
jgi:hypothetical protein